MPVGTILYVTLAVSHVVADAELMVIMVAQVIVALRVLVAQVVPEDLVRAITVAQDVTTDITFSDATPEQEQAAMLQQGITVTTVHQLLLLLLPHHQ